MLYKENILGANYIQERELDPLKYGSSFLLHEVTTQLIKINRTEAWQTELTELSLTDPNALFYLVDIYIAKDKLKEALTLLAKTLLKHPLMVLLLYKQALCLKEFKYFEFAVKIAKVCCDLCPNSFNGWLLYAECAIELHDYETALICLDLAPYN